MTKTKLVSLSLFAVVLTAVLSFNLFIPQGDAALKKPAVNPIILSVTASDIAQMSVTINWTLSKPATGQVEYGTTTKYGSLSVKESSLLSKHTQVLPSLTPGTRYHYRVRSVNQAGEVFISRDYTFTTTTKPPIQCALNISNAVSDGGFAYLISQSFNTPADTSTNPTQSQLHLLENGINIGPAHSVHADIRTLGKGRFSHWSNPDGSNETLRFSASDNSDPRVNGKSYCFVIGDATDPIVTAVVGPTISSLSVANITKTEATINWTLNEQGTGQVEYGTTNAYGSMGAKETSFNYSAHSQVISNLTPGTLYHYRVRSTNQAGQESISGDKTFTTTALTPPVAPSNLTTPLITVASVTLNWIDNATNETSFLIERALGTGPFVFLATIASNLTSYIDTTVDTLTSYWYRIASVNQDGQSGFSESIEAKTFGIISDITITDITQTKAVVNWKLSEPGTGQVEYGTTTAYGTMGAKETSFNYSAHSQVLSNLTPGTLYHYRVRSSNQAGTESISEDATFTTASPIPAPTPVVLGPTISSIAVSALTQTTATISWTLNEPGTGQIEYGTTNAYGSMGAKETSFNYSAHTQVLSNLTPGTLYHFRVRSTNQAGQESISGDKTFTTVSTAITTTLPPSTGNYHAPTPTSSLIVNVKDTGAKCDGVTDDTAAIQRAVDQVAGTGGTVLVPDGTCMIQQKFYGTGNNSGGVGRWAEGGIELKSNMTFKMSNGTVLKEITNHSPAYAVINIRAAQNVNVIGGTVQGDRATHSREYEYNEAMDYGGQDGNGISIWFSQNVYIEGVKAIDCWGDGFMMGGDYGGVWDFSPNKNINLYSVVADNNRRQGLSIIAGDTVVVRDSVFKNTHGHYPMAGIDIEPNTGHEYHGQSGGVLTSGDIVKNVLIANNVFSNNNGNQIDVFSWVGHTSNVTITGNRFASGYGMGTYDGNPSFNWNFGVGIRLDTKPSDGVAVTVTNNWIGAGDIGILVGTDFGATGNTITGNYIGAPKPISGNLSGNTISNNTTLIGNYSTGYPGAPVIP